MATGTGQSQKNGLAIIITNDYIGTDKKVLNGTHKDGQKMVQAFRELNYDISPWKNFSRVQLGHSLRQLVSSVHSSMYSCIVVVFSGHGTTDEKKRPNEKLTCIFTQEPQCQLFHVQEIVNYFMPTSASAIGTTPKVFLIDACLGDKTAFSEAVTVPKGITANFSGRAVTNKGGQSIATIDMPPAGNYILAYSTSVGYQSFETTEVGGLWLNALWRRIREKAYSDTVMNILSDVNEDLLQLYQDPSVRSAMTQPHTICQSHRRVYFVPQNAQESGPASVTAFNGTPHCQVPKSEPSGLGQVQTISCKTQLNNLCQGKKISEPKYEDKPVTTANGGKILATVSFLYLPNNKLVQCQSEPKDVKREAVEEAARNACAHIRNLEGQTSKSSAIRRPNSSPQQPSLSLRKQTSSSDTTPVQILKMGCESARYHYDLVECPTGALQLFQFKAIVKDGSGRILCEVIGSRKDSKKQAKHDAASKANAKLGFR